ncbi:MAG: hypothetical protein IT292_02140 [Deltaproteobacteria bacterium]|nr:hypothetical protein [Deltaproteobacteria bacterium]
MKKTFILRFKPNTVDSFAILRNIAYIYKSLGEAKREYLSAVQIEGAVGSGDRMIAEITADNLQDFLELINALPAINRTNVRAYDVRGLLLKTYAFSLPPNGFKGVALRKLLPKLVKGVIVVDSALTGDTVSSLKNYAKNKQMAQSLLPLSPVSRKVNAIAFNTASAQTNVLTLVNGSDKEARVRLSLYPKIANVDMGQYFNAPFIMKPFTIVKINLNALVGGNAKGQAFIGADQPNVVYAQVVRTSLEDLTVKYAAR